MIEDFIKEYDWYLLLVASGLLFRYILLTYKMIDTKLKIQKIAIQIATVIFITIMWGKYSVNDNGDIETSFTITMLFLGYCVYCCLKKMPECGYTDSLLLVINGLMITALSFMSFPTNIGLILLVIIVSWIIYRYWHEEKKSDFWEIIVLCIESFIVSLFMYIKNISEPVEIAMVVLFVESFLTMTNCVIKSFLVWICGEDVDEYWDNLMGLE